MVPFFIFLGLYHFCFYISHKFLNEIFQNQGDERSEPFMGGLIDSLSYQEYF